MPSQRGNDKSNKSIGNWSARRLDHFTRDNSASQSGILSIGPVTGAGTLSGVLAHSDMTISDLHIARSAGTRDDLLFRFYIDDVAVVTSTGASPSNFLVNAGQTVPNIDNSARLFPTTTLKKGQMFEMRVNPSGTTYDTLNGRVYASWRID